MKKLPTEGTVSRVVTQISQFGVVRNGFSNGELERQGLATIRYQTRGEREIICINYVDIKNYFTTKGKVVGADLLSFIKEFFGTASEQDWTDFSDAGYKIVKLLIPQGALTYIPAGYFTCERCVGTSMCIGIRTATVDSMNLQSFVKFVDDYSNSEKKEVTAAKFWCDVKALMCSVPTAPQEVVLAPPAESAKGASVATTALASQVAVPAKVAAKPASIVTATAAKSSTPVIAANPTTTTGLVCKGAAPPPAVDPARIESKAPPRAAEVLPKSMAHGRYIAPPPQKCRKI